MNIVLAIKSMALPGGGAERLIASLAGHWVAAGHEVWLMTFDTPTASSFYPLDPQVRWLRLAVGRVGAQATALETFRRSAALRRQIITIQPDIAVGFMHSMYVPLAMALIGTRIPVIGSEHIVREHYRRRPLQYALLLGSTFLIRRFTALSTEIARNYSWLFWRKAVAIPNPVTPIRCNASKSPDRPRRAILAVGKLEPQKDHLTLIRAFSQIVALAPEWDLRIVGDGSLRQTLEMARKDLGLSDRVSLPGAIKEIAREYCQADIFVTPSRYESFGLVTAEAMSAGLPVIGFKDCPGTNVLIEDGVSGLLAESEPDRVDNLAHALLDLIRSTERQRQLGENAAIAIRKYSPEEFYRQWDHLLMI